MTAMGFLLQPWALIALGIVGFLFFGYLGRKDRR
jgi:hypothetical protein